ncbi:MAG: PstS family phosphate ABC transporter substrate-binding protein [Thermoplasmatales archaeon]|nr:MAG: PstS family phosphate ABC transporter substrate-binding protein [Thermoplasmatales archaeon]
MRGEIKFVIVIIVILLFIAFFASYASERTKIKQKGSDTMLELAQLWAEEYVKVNNNVTLSISGGGSGTGIAQLINGQIDIADASRPIKECEIANAQSQGITPVEFKTCIDGIAIITNKNIDIAEISFDQLHGIYNGTISDWNEIGGPDRKITVYGRQSNSGTYVYFQEYVMNKNDYRTDMQPLNGNAQIVDAVVGDDKGIGYVGVAYAENRESELIILKIKEKQNSSAFSPTIENIAAGDYPISRYLYIYTNGNPSGEIANYITWILNEDGGQKVAENLGLIPLPSYIIEEELEKIT